MATTIRLLIVAGLVVLTHAGYLYVRAGGMPDESQYRPLRGELSAAIPNKIGPWTGQDLETDPEIFEATDAAVAVDRMYKNIAGAGVTLHSDIMIKFFPEFRHHPAHCYTSGGYIIGEQKRAEVTVDGKSFPVDILTAEKDNARIMVLYWYHFGDEVILDGQDLREARWSLRGKKVWPPQIKVMMQTDATDSEQAEARLKGLAALLYPYTDRFNRQQMAE